MEYRHIMIDVETLSDAEDAALVQLGAVVFDPNGDDSKFDLPAESIRHGRGYDRLFQANIFFDSAMKYGSVKGSTLEWWMGKDKNSPSEEARKSILKNQRMLDQALAEFRYFCLSGGRFDKNQIVIWGHATFDPVIVGHAYRVCPPLESVTPGAPWTYRNTRDLRTIIDLAYGYGSGVVIDGIPEGIEHNALSDAWGQAIMVQKCIQKIREEGILIA